MGEIHYSVYPNLFQSLIGSHLGDFVRSRNKAGNFLLYIPEPVPGSFLDFHSSDFLILDTWPGILWNLQIFTSQASDQ
jgi:hypothetical protein